MSYEKPQLSSMTSPSRSVGEFTRNFKDNCKYARLSRREYLPGFSDCAATATDPNGNITTYAYDVVDRLSGTSDALGRTTKLAYDTMSRRTQVLNTAIQSAPLLQQGYTADGLLASLTDASSHTTNFVYDGLDRLFTTTYPDTSTETLSYDNDSNVLSRKTRANQTLRLTYVTPNLLPAETPPSTP